jgi:hypothetical protein
LGRLLRNEELCKAIFIFGVLYIVIAFTGIQLSVEKPSLDEYWFMKQSQNLPGYSSTARWAYEWKELYWQGETIYPANWARAYDNPFWVHPPLAYILTYPIAGDYNAGRKVAIIIMLLSVSTMLYLAARRQPEKAIRNAGIATIPLVLGSAIITSRLNLYYNDIFMVGFLVSSLALRESKLKGWVWLPLTLMALTKIHAVIFLIPFVVENRKLALCTLGLIPFWVGAYIVTSDPLYLLRHWTNLAGATDRGARLLAVTVMTAPFLIASIPLLVQAIRRRQRFYPALYLLGALVSFGWAPYYYNMYPWYLSSAGLVGKEQV